MVNRSRRDAFKVMLAGAVTAPFSMRATAAIAVSTKASSRRAWSC
jgi:hypothetical protein